MLISGLQKLTLLDYPGKVACTVFTPGCNLRCPFCHNAPLVLPELVGQDTDEEQVLSFLRKRQGVLDGVAITGGEPLLQSAFVFELIRALHAEGFHTAIDTAGFAPYEHLKAVADQCDRVLYDVKSMDDAVHRSYIGVSNRQILDNLCRLADSDAEVIVRVPLIHNVNDSAENITRTAELAAAHGIREIDLIPFHRLGESKYAVIQQPYTMPDTTVPQEHIDALAALLRQRGFIVSIGG